MLQVETKQSAIYDKAFALSGDGAVIKDTLYYWEDAVFKIQTMTKSAKKYTDKVSIPHGDLPGAVELFNKIELSPGMHKRLIRVTETCAGVDVQLLARE